MLILTKGLEEFQGPGTSLTFTVFVVSIAVDVRIQWTMEYSHA